MGEGSQIRRENRLLSIADVASWLGVKVSTIYNWVHYEKIPYVKLYGKLCFETAKIEEFIRNNSHN